MNASILKLNHLHEIQEIRKDEANERIRHKKTEYHSSSICREENNRNTKVKGVSIMLKNKQNYTVYIYPKRRSKNVLPKNMKKDTYATDARRRSLSETRIKKSKPSNIIYKRTPFNTNFFVHAVPEYEILRYPFSNTLCKIYRCQISSQEETCCCACNSDAMFEVMKSLYDCYKKKNCDHCNCILCGHLPREERRLGELRKAGKKMVSTKLGTAKLEGILTPSKGKAEVGLRRESKSISAEKAVIAKIPSEKLRKAQAAGLLTPLEGKKTEEKEKILKGLAVQGIPLPVAKTTSEKKIIEKVRAEHGLPPEPKGSAYAKYEKALKAGTIVPPKGKIIQPTPSEKKKILEVQAGGEPKPEKSVIAKLKASEKPLIEKVRASVRPTSELKIPSEKLRKAQAAGLLTPLEGKKPEEKEKILKGLAAQGIPLPVAKTTSEKKIIEKVRAEHGLPPESKTSIDIKYDKAVKAGLIAPPKGKFIQPSPSEKKKILEGLAEKQIKPEKAVIAKTKAEKPLIEKVTASTRPTPELKVPSEKLRKAQAAGLLTPLEGKKPEEKEKILKGLAVQGIPLPVAKTTSEKKIIEKVRAEHGLPPESKTSIDMKYDKAVKAGLIAPPKGKFIQPSPSEKKKILEGLAEGQIKSEKAVITKTKVSEKPLIEKATAAVRPTPELKVPSEKLRKAQAAGLLTPLEGKKTEEKEKILKGLAVQGIPLPVAKTTSEKKIIEKVRAEHGLPPEPKISAYAKYDKAIKAGTIAPSKGKIIQPSPGAQPKPEKSVIIKTKASEKPLIEKVRASVRPTPELKVPSEKLRKAQAAGLLTPLEGKKPEEKEKIVKALAMQGIPLPIAKTTSEKKIIDKIRAEHGLPAEPKRPSDTKYDKVIKAGIRVSPSVSIPSARIRKAEAEGILTPLEGKTQKRKKEILQKLAESGIPLPEGKTSSEKALVRKIRASLVTPPKATTPSEKEIIKKAKAEGLLTPLKGKTTSQKIKILKGLAEAGVPMPEGTTASEKALVKKVRKDVGLTAELTPSEKKGKIRTESKKIGIPVSKKIAKAGVTEEFEDIIKTTTCDRGCGCDKKKIRFKHSYVKIRVTSPDISSLCPCPNECIPGVKGGVFTDNEGIKVTVGRIEGITPFYSTECCSVTKLASSQFTLVKHKMITTDEHTKKCSYKNTELEEVKSENHVFTDSSQINKKHCSAIISRSGALQFNEIVPLNHENQVIVKSQHLYETKLNNNKTESYENLDNVNEVIFINTNIELYKPISSKSSIIHLYENSFSSNLSLESVFLTETDSSLSYSSRSFEIASTSISCISLYSSNYSLTSFLSDTEDRSLVDLSKYNEDKIEYDNYTETVSMNSTTRSLSEISCLYEYSTDEESEVTYSKSSDNSIEDFYRDVYILRLSPLEILERDFHKNINNREISKVPVWEPFINVKESGSEDTINHIINQLILTRSLANSSLILIIPDTHDDMRKTKSDDFSSSICIQISENLPNRKNIEILSHNCQRTGANFETEAIKMYTNRKPLSREELSRLPIQKILQTDVTKNCKFKKQAKKTEKDVRKCKTISVDTTQDRPCCCSSNNQDSCPDVNDKCAGNVSGMLTPMTILKQAAAQAKNHEKYFFSLNKDITTCQSSSSSLNASQHRLTSIKLCKFSQCSGKISYEQITEKCMETCKPQPGECAMYKPKKIHKTEKKCISKQIGETSDICKAKTENKSRCDGSCLLGNIPSGIYENSKGLTMKCRPIDNCGIIEKKSIGCQCCPCKDAETATDSTHRVHKSKKVGKKRDKKKNVTCECSETTPPEKFEFDERPRCNMISDLTQTESELKIDMLRKKIEEEEMSFEDALKYFAENPIEIAIDENICSCNNMPKKQIECECPPCPIDKIEPFQGLKLHVEAKGSSSKGLSGVCCFDLIQIE